ncbi:hypothetical protein RIVM261_051360 [Rivularia sp. IAM M-261]|nr:hypothetical protein RIVM261_051360 [Rivularia sp. IAM M-261]
MSKDVQGSVNKKYHCCPSQTLSFVAQAVSKGDMTASFDDNYHDEIGELAGALKRIKPSLSIAMNLLSNQANSTK